MTNQITIPPAAYEHAYYEALRRLRELSEIHAELAERAAARSDNHTVVAHEAKRTAYTRAMSILRVELSTGMKRHG